MLTAKQKELRKQGVSATDISAICGLNPYKSAIDVALDKWDMTLPVEENEAMYWGTVLEHVVARRFAKAHKVGLKKVRETYELAGWMFATPDYLTCKEPIALVEIKTAGIRSAWRWGKEGDAIPEEYLMQCVWQMAVTGIDVCYVAVLIAGQDYREFELKRDLALENKVVDIGRKFYEDTIIGKNPPAPDASEAAKYALARLYPADRAPLVPADEEVTEWSMSLKRRKELLEEAEKRVREAENWLKARIGEAAGIEGPWGRITWKQSKETSKVNYQGVAEELHATPELMAKYTETKQGSRRFLASFKEA